MHSTILYMNTKKIIYLNETDINYERIENMIELIHLKQLVAFAEYGTLSKAAEKLYMSQPTLTRTMQKLEKEFNVTLFDHKKNKLSLNENGQLAYEYAKKILQASSDMIEHVRSFDRARHTISVGSCAPAPLWDIVPMLSNLYHNLTIGSEMRENDTLINGLNNKTYQIIILPKKIDNPDWICMRWGDEHLYFSLPKSHPLANKESLYMKDLDGENMLLFTDIGFWHHLPRREMPNSRFLLQNERFYFDELINSSILPAFTSDLAKNIHNIDENNRINIPIKDADANITYYCYCLKSEHEKLQTFIKKMKQK